MIYIFLLGCGCSQFTCMSYFWAIVVVQCLYCCSLVGCKALYRFCCACLGWQFCWGTAKHTKVSRESSGLCSLYRLIRFSASCKWVLISPLIRQENGKYMKQKEKWSYIKESKQLSVASVQNCVREAYLHAGRKWHEIAARTSYWWFITAAVKSGSSLPWWVCCTDALCANHCTHGEFLVCTHLSAPLLCVNEPSCN